jgi:1-deoxy-D-xylulose-5-phosphate reductoisomerase
VNVERYPAMAIALEAGRREDTTAAAVSGADEAAVSHFLAGRCRFTDIPQLLELALQTHQSTMEPDLDDLLAAEAWGRQVVNDAVSAGV